MKFKKILCYHVLGILLATSFVIMLIGSFRENLSVITVLYRSSIILTLVFIAALLEKNKKSINPGSSYDSHKLMQYFIEHTKDAMAILDTELRYLYASQSYYSDFRIKKKNIIGMFHSDVFPHFPDAWKNIPPRVFAGEILSGEDNAFELEDGTREWTKWECRPWYKEDNTIGGMIVYSERITEAKKMVQALQEREKRYTSLFEKNNATILLIDGENLNIVDANPAACKYYGWSREELIQKKITDINLFSLDEMLKEKENARSEGRNHLHFKHRLANGKIRDVKVYNGLLNIEGKEIFYSIVIDITKKKKIENKLKESEELYRAIYTASPDLICVSDLKGKILAISHVFTSMFGYKDETQAIGQYLINFIIETERFSAKRAFLKRLNGRHARSVQYHGLRSDSSIFDIEVNADFIQDKKGEPMKIVYVIRDVTERNRIQKDLLYSRERNEALLKANPNLMFMLNMEGRFIDFHPGNNQTLYISEREFLGKRIEEVMPIEIASLGNSYLKLLFQTGKNQVFDYPLQIGSEIKYFQGQLLKNGDSEALLVVSDITPRMILQKELIKAKETAEESDRLKSAFLANMSHEIRTPMNGILGFAELLKDSEITEEEKLEYLDIIDQSGHRLLNIINDIVEISKIEAGMIVPKITECNVNQHLEYVEKFFNPEAEKKGIHLMIKNGLSSTDAVLRTDSEKLYAILINLVKNAIKYSDKGTIEIGCTKDNAEFRFYVKDEGIGIPEDKQDAIFNRFVRVSSSQKRIIEGTGLGLAITKAYLDMLGGKMWVRSNPGEGSIFYFTLPRVNEIAEIKMEKDNNLENETFGKNINVLIAEDDEFTVKLLTRYLNPFSSRIYYATNGREAVEMYNSNPNIQLILMDVQMPEMDGYEATREIRKKDQDVIIIAQTAFALSDDKLSAFDAGCTDYISKPVSQETIRRIISKYF